MAHHYVFGSGMPGCLYDYGPHFVPRLSDALEDLSAMFGDLPKAELRRMRGNLRRHGVHYFAARYRGEAGASYCEVSKQYGQCPEVDE